MLISFVIPCYKSADTIERVVDEIQTLNFEDDTEIEVILANDESPDNTFEAISRLADKYDNVTGVDIAKNRGQQNAILAGMRYAKGELVVVSDDDGQTPIENVHQLIDKLNSDNCDVVCAHFADRGKRSPFRRLGSFINNFMVRYFLDRPDGIDTSVYFVARRFVVDEMIRYENPYPYMTGLLLRTTYRIGNVEVVQKERISGQSGYNFKRLFSLWVNGITSFSIKPLRFASLAGCVLALLGFAAIIVLIINKIINTDLSVGWTSLIATNILVGGLIMIILGVIGEYIGRIYLSLNKSPQYVVRQVIGKNSDKEQ